MTRKRKRTHPKRTAGERKIDTALAPMIAALTSPDAANRQALLPNVRNVALPVVRDLIIGRLIAVVLAQDEAEGRAAADTLAELGDDTVPFLLAAFAKSRDEAEQVKAVGCLGHVAQRLPPRRRSQVQWELELARARAVSVGVCLAIHKVDEHLQSTLDVAAGSG
jgi:hypothetical protein